MLVHDGAGLTTRKTEEHFSMQELGLGLVAPDFAK